MKIFENKSVFKKLIIVLLCILILSFCMPKAVRAEDDGIGGVLLSPVVDLLIGLGDGALNIIHTVIYNQNDTLLTVDMTNSILAVILTIAVFIFIAVVVAAAVSWASGALVTALTPILAAFEMEITAIGIGTLLIIGTTTGVVGAAIFNSNVLPDDLQLPVYSVSPEEIFSNEIGLFDVDFFNPDTDAEVNEYEVVTSSQELGSKENNMEELFSEHGLSTSNQNLAWKKTLDETYGNTHQIKREAIFKEGNNSYKVEEDKTITNYFESGTFTEYTEYTLYEVTTKTETMTEYNSIAYQLRPTISNWYNILRNISLVALLSILVYTGIRIVISSTSSDKAKYKQMLMDWVVAICLLFVMQYIMSFSNLLVEKITDIFKTAKYDEGYVSIIEDKHGKIEKALTDGGYDVSSLIEDVNGVNYIQWKTNLLGVSRLNAQMAKDTSTSYAGHALVFIVLVIFTVYFIFTYLKRVLYMAFLTLIAPLVALTYPIDKMTDGKAQAFNSWFKEYIFNLLIQPMHLLLYTILVSSAFELAATNIIYSLVALAFMMPAEKLLRKFFGFSKAETPGLLGGAAGAAIMMSGINKLLNKPKKGEKGSGSGSKDKSSDDDSSNIKYKDDIENSDSVLFGNDDSENGQGGQSPQSRGNSGEGNNSNTGNEDNQPRDKWDIPIEDRFANWRNDTAAEIKDDFNYMRDAFNDTSLGKGINKAKSGVRKIKNGVSNSAFGRAVKNSRTLQAGKAGLKFYGNGLKKKIEDKINNSHPLRAVPKVAVGAATGITAGALGLAAGISSGDFGKSAQYTAGAAAAAYAFGGSGARSIANALSVEGTGDIVKEAYYGKDEYKEREIQKNIKKVQRDDKIRRELAKRLGDEEEAERAMEEASEISIRHGLEKANEIAAVYERMKAGETGKAAVAQVKYVNEYGKNTAKLGHKDSEDLNNTIMDRVRRNSKEGTTKEQMEENARRIREKFDAASKVVYKKL